MELYIFSFLGCLTIFIINKIKAKDLNSIPKSKNKFPFEKCDILKNAPTMTKNIPSRNEIMI
jgi:hypothetical protein